MEASARRLLCQTSQVFTRKMSCLNRQALLCQKPTNLKRHVIFFTPKFEMRNSSRFHSNWQPFSKTVWISFISRSPLLSLQSKVHSRLFSYIRLLTRNSTSLKACLMSLPLCFLTYKFSVSYPLFQLVKSAECEAGVPPPNVPPLLAVTGQNGRLRSLCYSLWDFIRLSLRAAHLYCIFLPLLLLYPITFIGPKCFTTWINLLFIAVERSGGTFIKLGQWASTRRDLFSKEVCDCFSQLHREVRPHSWAYTVQALKEAYGKDWEKLLHLTENQKPIGSGCIAQVYKGYVSADFLPTAFKREMEEESNKVYFGEGIEICTMEDTDDLSSLETSSMSEELIPVAIKVLHPNVRETFERDLRLMKTTAKYLTKLFPRLHWVNLNQCVEEFSISMQKQLDMRHECRCLQKFAQDFSSAENIKVPLPIPKLVRRNILVETYEEGISIGQIASDPDQPADLKEELAKIGMDVLLQMVFVNNFVHADMHPGNLLVQNVENYNKQKTALVQVDAMDMMVVNLRPVEESPLKVVLLDCGITTSLGPDDQKKFREVFTAVVKGEGEVVADLFLSKSAVNQCLNHELFRKEMALIVFKGRQNLMSISKIKVAELMNEVFSVLSRHKIQLESSFANVILAMAMLEGLGRSLYPDLDLLERSKPILLGSLFS